MNATQEITIKVSPKVAYQNATEQEKQKLQSLVNLFFEQNASNSDDLLGAIMNQISDQAQE